MLRSFVVMLQQRWNWPPWLRTAGLSSFHATPEEIWNRCFISPIRRNVYTNPSRKPSFRKLDVPQKEEEFGNVSFSSERKGFENEAFWKRWRDHNHEISLTKFSSNTNPKLSGDCCLLNFSGSADGEDLQWYVSFQSKISIFKFLWRVVNEWICLLQYALSC